MRWRLLLLLLLSAWGLLLLLSGRWRLLLLLLLSRQWLLVAAVRHPAQIVIHAIMGAGQEIHAKNI